jgi:hypothetical protein
MFIEAMFEPRTLANMNVALDRVCDQAPDGENHAVRKRIAIRIIRCARSGKVTLGDLTAAGRRGLPRFAHVRKRIDRRRAPAPTAVSAGA